MFRKIRTTFLGGLPTRAESEAFDQGRSPARTEVRSASIRVGRPPGQKRIAFQPGAKSPVVAHFRARQKTFIPV